MKHKTLTALIEAYKRGDGLTGPIRLDNDTTDVYANHEKVFSMHPVELLEQALDLLGVPWEHV